MIWISERIVLYLLYYTKYKFNDMIEVRGAFFPWFNSCLIITFLFPLNLICLTSVGLSTIRTGILPIRMTDYRYLVIFLHGSTCWLGNELVPDIQLEKLSIPTRRTMLRCEVIGRTWLRYFPHWLSAILPDGSGRRDFKHLRCSLANGRACDIHRE